MHARQIHFRVTAGSSAASPCEKASSQLAKGPRFLGRQLPPEEFVVLVPEEAPRPFTRDEQATESPIGTEPFQDTEIGLQWDFTDDSRLKPRRLSCIGDGNRLAAGQLGKKLPKPFVGQH